MLRIFTLAAAIGTLSVAGVAPAMVPTTAPAVAGPLVTTDQRAEIAVLDKSSERPAEAFQIAMRPNDGQSMLGLCMSAGGSALECIYWRLTR